MQSTLMACGCAAQGTRNGVTACVVHGITEVAKEVPNLEGRMAYCTYGKHKGVPSRLDLAFFIHKPTKEHDSYYCGCLGWD